MNMVVNKLVDFFRYFFDQRRLPNQLNSGPNDVFPDEVGSIGKCFSK